MGIAHLILLGLIISLTRQGGDFFYNNSKSFAVLHIELRHHFDVPAVSDQAGRKPGEIKENTDTIRFTIYDGLVKSSVSTSFSVITT